MFTHTKKTKSQEGLLEELKVAINVHFEPGFISNFFGVTYCRPTQPLDYLAFTTIKIDSLLNKQNELPEYLALQLLEVLQDAGDDEAFLEDREKFFRISEKYLSSNSSGPFMKIIPGLDVFQIPTRVVQKYRLNTSEQDRESVMKYFQSSRKHYLDQTRRIQFIVDVPELIKSITQFQANDNNPEIENNTWDELPFRRAKS